MIRSVAQHQARAPRPFPVECWIYQGRKKPLARAQVTQVAAITHAAAEIAARERFKDRHIRSLTWIAGPKIRIIIDPKLRPRASRVPGVQRRVGKLRLVASQQPAAGAQQPAARTQLERKEDRRRSRKARAGQVSKHDGRQANERKG